MIITHPNKILREKSKPVPADMIFGSEIKILIKKMRQELKIAGGVGLAAVQINELWRVILVENNGEFNAFINPKIIKKSWGKITTEEGCLSVPGKFGNVRRSKNIVIAAINEQGEKIKIQAEGLSAIIFQHEIDHTNGILFIDKTIKKTWKQVQKK